MSEENRSKIFSAKGEEFQTSLEQWARENNLVSHDEIMEVALTVTIRRREPTPLQYIFSEENSSHEVSRSSASPFEKKGGKLLKPVILVQAEAEILLSRLTGQARESMLRFFATDRRPFNTVIVAIHKACEEPINGKYYRLMMLKGNNKAQMWEVQPPK